MTHNNRNSIEISIGDALSIKRNQYLIQSHTAQE
jgi:hypothetical protein